MREASNTSHRATPVAFLLPKLGHANPMQLCPPPGMLHTQTVKDHPQMNMLKVFCVMNMINQKNGLIIKKLSNPRFETKCLCTFRHRNQHILHLATRRGEIAIQEKVLKKLLHVLGYLGLDHLLQE